MSYTRLSEQQLMDGIAANSAALEAAHKYQTALANRQALPANEAARGALRAIEMLEADTRARSKRNWPGEGPADPGGRRSSWDCAGDDDLRRCVCCGAPTPSRTMCACWPHWMALPENLRSEILTSYGRGELTNYHRHLLRAVEIWRQRGVWRVRSDDA